MCSPVQNPSCHMAAASCPSPCLKLMATAAFSEGPATAHTRLLLKNSNTRGWDITMK